MLIIGFSYLTVHFSIDEKVDSNQELSLSRVTTLHNKNNTLEEFIKP